MKIALYAQGLIGILVPDMPDAACAAKLRKLAEIFGDRAYVSLYLRRRSTDQLVRNVPISQIKRVA